MGAGDPASFLPRPSKEPGSRVFAKGQRGCAGQLKGTQGHNWGWKLLCEGRLP